MFPRAVLPRALVRRAAAVAVVGMAAVAIALPVPAAEAGAPSSAASRGVTALTPILSVRRLPEWITTTVARQRLAAGLPAVLARLGPAAATSCRVVSQGGQVFFADHPSMEVVPASNMKVLTATAVLEKLGSTARLTTAVKATAPPVHGTLHGNLYLIGGGDPLLWTEAYETMQVLPEPLFTSLATLAARVRAAGITRVTGSVLGDEGLFDTVRNVASWDPSYQADGNVGPLSALEVNNGFRLTPPRIAAAQPAVMAAGVFSALLRADGVKVVGHAAAGTASPAAVPVTSIVSAPLGQIVDAVLRVSDDTGAELLVKLLGRRIAGVGSTAAGSGVLRADWPPTAFR